MQYKSIVWSKFCYHIDWIIMISEKIISDQEYRDKLWNLPPLKAALNSNIE